MNEVQGPTALGHWRTVWHAAMWQAVRVLADPGRAGARVAQSKRRQGGECVVLRTMVVQHTHPHVGVQGPGSESSGAPRFGVENKTLIMMNMLDICVI